MIIVKPSETNLREIITNASGIIERGGIIAYPTETFYGLGVKYDNVHALEKLYLIKRRPKQKTLPVIIGDKEMLKLIVSSINAPAQKLMERFWPGPLTLIMPAREDLPELITSKTGKVAVRIPGVSFAFNLAISLVFPLTATSANISGMPPSDNIDSVIEYFGNSIDMIIDCGKTPGGQPSTIADVSGDKVKILRTGAIPDMEIAEVLNIMHTINYEK